MKDCKASPRTAKRDEQLLHNGREGLQPLWAGRDKLRLRYYQHLEKKTVLSDVFVMVQMVDDGKIKRFVTADYSNCARLTGLGKWWCKRT